MLEGRGRTGAWLVVVSALVAATVTGCGDDDGTPVGLDAGGGSDAGAATADAGGGLDAGAGSDAGAGGDGAAAPASDHASYVPPGLAPTAAARLIVLGDSISTGTGASDRATLSYFALLRQNDDTTWADLAAIDLESKLGTAPELVNLAVGGATTSSMVRTQIPALHSRFPAPVVGHSIVVITIGGNDLQGAIVGGNPTGAPLTTAIANLRTTIEALQDPVTFPDGTSIYVMDVYDPSDGTGRISGCFFGLTLTEFIPALDVWREQYIALGTELGFAVVDALGHFHGHGKNFAQTDGPYYDAADPTGWFYDCIHPNDLGHNQVRRLFFEAIDGTYRVAD